MQELVGLAILPPLAVETIDERGPRGVHDGAPRGVDKCGVVGANAAVLGGFTVGAGARVGSGAVVTKPVPAGATAVGNPARIIQAQADAAARQAEAGALQTQSEVEGNKQLMLLAGGALLLAFFYMKSKKA